MKVNKNLITAFKPFVYQGELDVNKWVHRPGYGVKAFRKCEVDVEIYIVEEDYSDSVKYYADVYAKATLLRLDSRTLEEYEEEVEIDENVEILSSIFEEGEGYVFPEKTFELEDLVFAMVLSSLPLVSRRESSSLPQGGEGYDVYEEGGEKNDDVIFMEEEGEGEEGK